MQAIVLSRTDVREFDQMVSVYTREAGRQDALVRGVKKIVSKNAPHLEPFSFVMIEMVKGKEFAYITKVQPLSYFSAIRRSVEKSLSAQFAVALVRQVSHVGEKDEEMFMLLYTFLSFLNKTEGREFCIYLDTFVIKCFGALGFAPQLDACVVCGKSIREVVQEDLNVTTKQKCGFYFAGGGLVCANCLFNKKRVGEQVVECGIKGISLMDRLVSSDWQVIERAEISDTDRKALHILVYAFTLYHHEKHVVDWKSWCG